MMTESGTRNRSHGLRRELLHGQALRMGVQIVCVPSSWALYEERFAQTLDQFALDGFTHGIYGDIDFPENRRWAEQISARAGVIALEPLWSQGRAILLTEFLQLGFKAKIVAIKQRALPPRMLGQDLGWDLLEEIQALGCDVSGEKGEYHTVVYDGPIFSTPLPLVRGESVSRGGYLVLDYRLATGELP
jgi:uncharacterized protein (TIGR00290 family)